MTTGNVAAIVTWREMMITERSNVPLIKIIFKKFKKKKVRLKGREEEQGIEPVPTKKSSFENDIKRFKWIFFFFENFLRQVGSSFRVESRKIDL